MVKPHSFLFVISFLISLCAALVFLAFPLCAADLAAELPGKQVDASLAAVPYHYARINAAEDEIAGLYYDPLSASVGNDPADVIPYGKLRYVSYSEQSVIDGCDYVKNKQGMWLRASPAEIPLRANGIILQEEPEVRFGWVLKDTHPSPFSGVTPDENLGTWKQNEILVWDQEEERFGTIWYRIAPGRWIDGFSFQAADLSIRPEFETKGKRWIAVDLTHQILTAWEDTRPVFAALIASGVEDFTRPGVFPIREKLTSEDMFGALKADHSDYFYLEDVPYTMYFDEERAIHGIYWPAALGFPQSHGCINMMIGDACWLFQWAEAGDLVWIYE